MATEREIGYDINSIFGEGALFAGDSLFGEDARVGGNSLLLGGLQRTSTAYGRVATVKAGEDMRPALESLKQAGGGTLLLLSGVHTPEYDIVGASNISIIGEGIDSTIIDFQDRDYNLNYIWDGSTEVGDFTLSNLTVRNSAKTLSGGGDLVGAIYLEGCQEFRVENVRLFSNTYTGIEIYGCEIFQVINCQGISNGREGFDIDDRATHGTSSFLLLNCLAQSNGRNGFNFDTANNTVTDFSVIGCIALSNTNDGFEVDGNTTAVMEGYFAGCSAEGNQKGFDISALDNTFVGCQADSNTIDGFEISAANNRFIGCSAASNTTFDFQVTEGGVFIGCTYGSSSIGSTEDAVFQMIGGADQDTVTRRQQMVFKNVSGGNLVAGDVVVMAFTATTLSEVSTTTTAGNDKVIGVVPGEATIANNANFQLAVEGVTTSVKVDGTADIAIGDYLSCSTTAGVAKKAAAGETVFAVAQAAYTTDDALGVIRAWILPWRMKI